MGLIANLKIKTKILIGFISVVCFSLILGLISYNYISKIVYSEIPLLIDNHELYEFVLEMGKNEKNFLLYDLDNPQFFQTGNSEYTRLFEENYTDFLEMIDQMQDEKLIQQRPETKEKLNQMRHLAESYHNGFLNIVEKHLERGFKDYGVVGTFRSTIHTLEGSIEEFALHENLEILMLQARRAEKDYLLRKDLAYQDKLTGLIEQFKAYIDDAEYDVEIKNQLLGLLDTYHQQFQQIVAIDQEIGFSAEEGLLSISRTVHQQLHPLVEEVQKQIHQIVLGQIRKIRRIIMGIIGIIVILGLGISVLVTRPINRIVQKARELADGNLYEEIEVERNDEVGELALALRKMQLDLKDLITNIHQTAKAISLSSEQLAGASEESANASDQVSTTIQMLTDGADDQTISANETKVVVSELLEVLDQVNQTFDQMSQSSERVSEEANQGQVVVDAAVQQMEVINQTTIDTHGVIGELRNKSEKIVQVLDVISNLSDQTNLLALNASIEAARAGEYGKGFSVVAGEIRTLAEQSQASTVQIADLVNEIMKEIQKVVGSMESTIEAVDSGKKVVLKTGQSFEKILNSVRENIDYTRNVSSGMKHIQLSGQKTGESMEEMVQQIREFASGMQEVSASVEEQTAHAEETSVAADELSNLADRLEELIDKFKL